LYIIISYGNISTRAEILKMAKKPKYYINKEGEFVINNYNLAKPFSSFFPGIAGAWGVPIWAFYVNRGQAIASFGIKNKDHPVMEFQPANKSYYLTPVVGFRTFIKQAKGKNAFSYDAFAQNASSSSSDITNSMTINSSELKLKETNKVLGLEVDIEYFTIPEDNFGALARKLTIKNLSSKSKNLQMLDGVPQIVPYGTNNMFQKDLARTIEAWMGVENLNNNIPFLRLKVDPADRPEVLHIKEGNFYLAFDHKGLIKPIVDPEAIFATAGDFTYPKAFFEDGHFSYPANQSVQSRTPCCMSYSSTTIKAHSSYTIYTLSGNMDSLDKLKANTKRIAKKSYFDNKQLDNKRVISEIQSNAFMHSASKNLDSYCAQNFLDNVMRGGYPLSVDSPSGPKIIQTYSRKHGDLERDYNHFLVEPTYFSQGNGNYRDVNQNRRCDNWFNLNLKEESILNLFSLIQTDGFNPLVIRPDRFVFNQDFIQIKHFFNSKTIKKVKPFLKDPFTPGELFLFLEQNNIYLRDKKDRFLKTMLENSTRLLEAAHGEGFWVDHWHYCLDMLENYLLLYPEDLRTLLFEKKDFTYFDNAHVVKPRDEKYVLVNNKVCQFHGVAEDHHKATIIKRRPESPNLSRINNGTGKVYKTILLVKMLTVIANKLASLDPSGIGVEMEADKPGWYDSLNGLPGLLGSATSETFELKRWILFLQDSIKKLALDASLKVKLPQELYELITGLESIRKQGLSDYKFWDKTHILKERYRAKTLLGFDGPEKSIDIKRLNNILECFLGKVEKGIEKSFDKKKHLYNAYYINEVTSHKVVSHIEYLRHVKALKFKQRPLPLFLEPMVHALKVTEDKQSALKIFSAVRKSDLFDKKLKMYKVNAPLKDMPEEIGRTRVFAPGWLENESIWLHMEYKYLLGLLKNGLYDQFYKDIKTALVPFQDPEVYGRSTLENSSFIASSAFPQEKLHGNGFVARLSGSTAEFINIWLIMSAGKNPFSLDKDKKLHLELKPILPSWLFTKRQENGFKSSTFAFNFLSKTLVVYHNPKRKNTFGRNAAHTKEIRIKPFNGREIVIKSSSISAPYSYDVRSGKIKRIDVYMQ